MTLLQKGLIKRRNNLLSPIRTFAFNGDTNGILYYLGVNKGATAWSNPNVSGDIVIASSGWRTDVSSLNILTDRVINSGYTNDSANSWVSVDLKTNRLTPNYYSFRQDGNSGYYTRTWRFEASNDFSTWDILDTQTNNTTIQNPYDWVSIPVSGVITSYRYFRLLMNATNTAGTNEFCICEFEFYGVAS